MKKLFVVSSLAMIVGCIPNMKNVLAEKERGGGTAKVYSVDYERAWTTAENVLRGDGAGTLE